MSTNPVPYSKFEQKNVELITKIARKTAEGKVKWSRVAGSLFAILPGKMRAEFTVPTSSPIAFLRGLTPEDWKSFSIKVEENYLVAVENQGPLVTALKGQLTLTAAAQVLFNTIVERATGELEKAIEAVDGM
jgi:hypothetical protein